MHPDKIPAAGGTTLDSDHLLERERDQVQNERRNSNEYRITISVNVL